MARLRLQTQLLVSGLLIISILTGALLLVIRYTIRAQIAEQVNRSTADSVQGFDTVQRQFQYQLSRTAGVLAEIPTLKALMTTRDALTIQDGSTPFWQLSGSDLFLLADSQGRIVSLHLTHPGMNRQYAEERTAEASKKAKGSAWWFSGERLYWVFLRPIQAGSGNDAKMLGMLAIGYEADSGFAEPVSYVSESKIILVANHKVLASPFSAEEESELADRVGAYEISPSATATEIPVGTERYVVMPVQLNDQLPPPVQCYVLVSVTRQTAFIRTLNRTILILGISAVCLAVLLLSFVSSTITRPLENLVAAVRALASGDYAYSIHPRGSSEVAELGESFSKMRGDLLAFQQKQIETERVAAVGHAANSISHDLRHHLATIIANAEFLHQAEVMKLNRDEIYGEIRAASDQMTEMLDSLRDWAREERSLSATPASMDQTARRAALLVQTRPEFRDVEIHVHSSGDMAGIFDPRKMERVFLNLTVNACEAFAGNRGQIAIGLSSTASQFEIRISDNGPGIPDSIRDTLFDPFVSAGKANGTGLGLAIVSKIVRDHGGTIVVEKTSHAGTTFLILMPRFQRAPNAALQSSTA